MHRNIYRSGFEQRIAADLEDRGIPFDFEKLQLEYRTTVRGGICTKCECRRVEQRRKYLPDFVVPRDAGRLPLIIEAKGILDGPTRSKMRDIARHNPNCDIRFLFDGKATWKRGKAMAAWAEKYNFRYAFGHQVPEEWL